MSVDYQRPDLLTIDPLGLLTGLENTADFTTALDPLPYKNADIQGPPLRDRKINPEIMYAWARLVGTAPSGPQFVGVTDDGKLKTDAQVTATATFVDYSKRLAAGLFTNNFGGIVYTVPNGFKAIISEIAIIMAGSPTTRVTYQVTGVNSYYLKWNSAVSQFTCLVDQYHNSMIAGEQLAISFGTASGISTNYSVSGYEIPV